MRYEVVLSNQAEMDLRDIFDTSLLSYSLWEMHPRSLTGLKLR